jgi:hypothetical protein
MRRSRNPAAEVPFVRNEEGTFSFGLISRIPPIDKYHPQREEGYCSSKIAACFLGNKAENEDFLVKCLVDAIHCICRRRKLYHPGDPTPVTPEVMASPEYRKTLRRIAEASVDLTNFMNEYSLPFYSMRYQGHMIWDITLPSIIGYFTAMLDNPNNVSIQGSTATTLLERMVGLDICGMIGFDLVGKVKPWSHLTCDGTVANMESVWSARELKFLPLAIQDSLKPGEAFGKIEDPLKVRTPDKGDKEIRDMDTWDLLNLQCDDILEIPTRISDFSRNFTETKCKTEDEVWEILMHRYSLGARGLFAFANRLAIDKVELPVVIVPSSNHYSWPKSTSVLGLGYQNKIFQETDTPHGGLLSVPVDVDARMDKENIDKVLSYCRDKKVPVLQVVAVMGSTEESAVDPLTDIIALRNKLRENNMDFNIHADAAWGGYLLSAMRKPFEMPTSDPDTPNHQETGHADEPFDTDEILLSDYTIQNMKAIRECDSVTIDPHKWGYVPYPAGSLSYRNCAVIKLVTFGAPYIDGHGDFGSLPPMGECGIEGSKPGASAAAVFMSHRILRPDRSGYGNLIQGAIFNAKLFFIHLLRIGEEYKREQIDFKPYVLREKQVPNKFWENGLVKKFMNREISDEDFIKNFLRDISLKENLNLFRSLGPDQSTLAYAFNWRGNTSLTMANKLNDSIFHKLYPDPKDGKPISIDKFDMFITRTTFSHREYGDTFVKDFAKGLGISFDHMADKITCLRSVVMDPWIINTLKNSKDFDFIGSTLIPALIGAVESSGKSLDL